MPEIVPSPKKYLILKQAIAVILIGVVLYFGTRFVVFKRSETQLFYVRNSGLLLRISPLGAKQIGTYPKEKEVKLSLSYAGTTLEAITEDENRQIYMTMNIFKRNSSGGFDLVVTGEYEKNAFGTFDGKLKEYQQKYRVRKAARNLPEDSPKANNMIIPVPDEPEIAGILAAASTGDYTKAVALLESPRGKHPQDLFLNILKLDLLSLSKNAEGLEAALAVFEKEFPSTGDDLVDYTIKSHRLSLVVIESLKADTNAYQRIPFRQDAYHYSDAELIHGYIDFDQVPVFTGKPLSVLIPQEYEVINFLAAQNFVKVKITEGNFLLISGNIPAAQKLGFQLSRMGTGLTGNGQFLITRLIGVAVSAITVDLNQNVYLNAYQNADDLEAAFADLEQSYKEFILAISNDELQAHPANELNAPFFQPNLIEAQTRANTSLAKMANLHTAASMRHYYLKHNTWPALDSSGELVQSIDLDPFAVPSNSLKIITQNNDRIVYSIGPDKIDQQASVEYDPTNGTISSGDISLIVRQKPLYGFPSQPKQYNTREELLRYYPEGLPADVYADTRFQSLLVTDTTPPVVWSFGPDGDQSIWIIKPELNSASPLPGYSAARLPNGEWRQFENSPDRVVYDPSNGTVSRGNLYLRFPTNE